MTTMFDIRSGVDVCPSHFERDVLLRNKGLVMKVGTGRGGNDRRT